MAATRVIDLVTEIPGPRSREVLDRRRASVASPLAITFPIVAAAARGATITDVDGNTFIDFAGGVGCLNVGHSHPHVVAGGAGAARPLQPHRLHGRPLRDLRDARRAPARAGCRSAGRLKAAFFNAGTEAVENAVKFARAYTGRPAVIAFEGAFHGRTLSLARRSPRRRTPTRPGSARSRPRSTACPSRTPTAGRRRTRRWRRSTGRSRPGRGRERRRDRVRAGPGRGRLHLAPREFVDGPARDLRRARDRPRLRRGADRLRAHRALLRDRALRRRAGPDHGRQVDREGLPLSGVLGRAEIMDAPVAAASAAPTSATRSRRRPRSPCST